MSDASPDISCEPTPAAGQECETIPPSVAHADMDCAHVDICGGVSV